MAERGENLLETARRCVSTTDRVNFIEQLKLHGMFQPGKTPASLRAVWDVHDRTLYNYIREAERRLQREVNPKDVTRRKVELLGFIDRVKHEAARDRKWTAAITAAKLEASVLGLLITKVELNAEDRMLESWSTTELEDYVSKKKLPTRLQLISEVSNPPPESDD